MRERDWQADVARLERLDRKARFVLGVSATADRAEIRRAFRTASLAHHPDANAGTTEAAWRFHLVCCAYKFLLEGESCATLDALEEPKRRPANGKYHLDNAWGYWCWWREAYFDLPLKETTHADL